MQCIIGHEMLNNTNLTIFAFFIKPLPLSTSALGRGKERFFEELFDIQVVIEGNSSLPKFGKENLQQLVFSKNEVQSLPFVWLYFVI